MKLKYIGIYSNKRGTWPFNQTYYSMCSAHNDGRHEDCLACNAGTWYSDVRHSISSVIYKTTPGIWRWWVNKRYRGLGRVNVFK